MLLAPQSLGQIAGRGEPRALAALLEMTADGANGGPCARRRPSVRSGPGRSTPICSRWRCAASPTRGNPRATERLRAIESGTVRRSAPRAINARQQVYAPQASVALNLAGELDGSAPRRVGRRAGLSTASSRRRVAAARDFRISAPALRLAVDPVFDPSTRRSNDRSSLRQSPGGGGADDQYAPRSASRRGVARVSVRPISPPTSPVARGSRCRPSAARSARSTTVSTRSTTSPRVNAVLGNSVAPLQGGADHQLLRR